MKYYILKACTLYYFFISEQILLKQTIKRVYKWITPIVKARICNRVYINTSNFLEQKDQ